MAAKVQAARVQAAKVQPVGQCGEQFDRAGIAGELVPFVLQQDAGDEQSGRAGWTAMDAVPDRVSFRQSD